MTTERTPIGRFAPTPSGPLHFGSVVAAVASWLAARAAGGRWLLRLDDLDAPRCVPGAAEAILATLVALGLEWDGEVVLQSARARAYGAALDQLAARDALYACACSRRIVGGGRYPGTCAGRGLGDGPGRALRVRVTSAPVAFDDLVQGRYTQCLATQGGDFVVRRADGPAAYHLACVVDDAAAEVNQIVRGVDLIESTPRQIHLQRLLDLPQPVYAHVATVLDAAGDKLSKQTRAAAIVPATAPRALFESLRFLGLAPAADADGAPVRELLDLALARWSWSVLPAAPRLHAWPSDAQPRAASNMPRSSV